MKTLAVIPARYGSTRLPGKPLVSAGGVPLVTRVFRQVARCRKVDRIVVGTDDAGIEKVMRSEGAEVMMTPRDLPSGGDRVAWVAARIPEAEIVLNVQVDDPLVGPDMIDPLVESLESDSGCGLAVLAKQIEDQAEITDSNIVKMVFDGDMRALYFSRSAIPYPRNPGAVYYKHIGPYAYRRDLLLAFARWDPTPLEKIESLEMLRILEKGHNIRCVKTERDTIEIDTPEDVARLEAWLREHGDDVK
ncbi:MAG: 3-deoxy-manno-octulosonate cytidylyltransferase [Thermovirgaceae bacterium]